MGYFVWNISMDTETFTKDQIYTKVSFQDHVLLEEQLWASYFLPDNLRVSVRSNCILSADILVE